MEVSLDFSVILFFKVGYLLFCQQYRCFLLICHKLAQDSLFSTILAIFYMMQLDPWRVSPKFLICFDSTLTKLKIYLFNFIQFFKDTLPLIHFWGIDAWSNACICIFIYFYLRGCINTSINYLIFQHQLWKVFCCLSINYKPLILLFKQELLRNYKQMQNRQQQFPHYAYHVRSIFIFHFDCLRDLRVGQGKNLLEIRARTTDLRYACRQNKIICWIIIQQSQGINQKIIKYHNFFPSTKLE